MDEIWNISDGPPHSHNKNGQNRPRGSAWGCQNVFCFFVINATRPFDHLSCTDFGHFWNNRRESLYAYVHRWKKIQFLSRGFSRSQKQPKMRKSGRTDDENGELREKDNLRWGEWEAERLGRGWRNESPSWFPRQGVNVERSDIWWYKCTRKYKESCVSAALILCIRTCHGRA